MPATPDMVDFFVSRRGSAAGIAQDIAEILEQAGYSVRVQDLDIRVGDIFTVRMHEMLTQCRHLIAILSADYLEAPFTVEEWGNFLAAAAPSGGTRRLIPIRVEDVAPTGIFAGRVYEDLVGVTDPDERRRRVLSAVRGIVPLAAEAPAPAIAIERPAAAASEARSNLPRRNVHFIGRTRLLEQIHRTLSPHNAAAKPVALLGLGGVGKSSLAIEYAHLYAAAYDGIWWITADNHPALIDGLAQLAAELGGGHRGIEKRHEELARAALARIAGSAKPWLLVYDNVESRDDIESLMPRGRARLIITTRFTNWVTLASQIAVEPLKPMEATRLLMTHAGRSGRVHRAGAVRLARELGCLPLALEQASAYVHFTGISFDRYADRARELIAKSPGGVEQQRNAFATFRIAIERAVSECPAAEKLLAFLSVLAPERIPYDLVDDSILSEDERELALARLTAVSLIGHETDDDGASFIFVHRLVREAMQARIKAAGGLHDAIAAAIKRLADAFPHDTYSNPGSWPRSRQLLPHALMLREEAIAAKLDVIELAHLLEDAAYYLLGRDAFADAEPLFKDTVEIGRRMLGPEHALVGRWYNGLGSLYLNSGRHDEAKGHYFQAVSIGIKAHGMDDVAVATRMNNFAIALHKAGDDEKAEAYFQQAVDITARVCPPGHPKHHLNGARLNNFADFLASIGEAEEAEELYRKAVRIGMETLGAKHPSVCSWRKGLANLLRDTQRHGEAEKLYRSALSDLLDAVGPEHSSVAFTREDLADLLKLTGRLEEALAEASQAVAIHERLFGSAHEWTRGALKVRDEVLAALDPGRAAADPAAQRDARKQAG